jgi:hypothetical protein
MSAQGQPTYRGLRRALVSPRVVFVVTLAAGVAGLFVAYYIPNPYTKTIPPFLLAGAVVGAVVKNREVAGWWLESRADVLSCLYFLLAGGTIALYTLRGYQRTQRVQLLLLGLFVLAALLVFAFDSVLGKLGVVILTAVIHRSLIYYASAVQIGMDALFHNRSAKLIAEAGSLEPLATSKYWYAPVYHLLTATGVQTLGVSARDASFALVTVVSSIAFVLLVYLFLERVWGATVGALGGLLYIAADHAVFRTIHTSPTTLGVVATGGLLLFAELYLSTGRRKYLRVYGLLVAGMIFIHQLSMFIATVLLCAYVGMYLVWERTIDRRGTTLLGLLLSGFLFQSVTTKYGGPASDTGSFLATAGTGIVQSILNQYRSEAGRVTGTLPPDANVAVSGADALSIPQTTGMAILFGFAVAGAIFWLSQREEWSGRIAVCTGTSISAASVLVFGAPIFGVNALIPSRWFAFLYLFLAVLAAPGVLAVLASLSDVSTPSAQAVLFVGGVLLLLSPYTLFMLGNSFGATDNPLFDDAPGATRLAVTEQEAQTYRFVDRYGTGARVVSDFAATQQIERHFHHPSSIYETDYGEARTSYEGELLLVRREYASTEHVSYLLRYQGESYRVFGSLPSARARDSIVYTTGSDRVLYRVES